MTIIIKFAYLQIHTLHNMALNNPITAVLKQANKGSNESFESSYDSIINDLSVEQSKFCSLFIQNFQLFNAHAISSEIIHPHHLFGQKFITYRIKVITNHISYTIDKRYRDFLQLYNKVSMFYQPKTFFPKKTHFRSKICPMLTEQRKSLFNEFMKELISMRNCNKSVITQFIMFLNMREHYKHKQLNQQILQSDKIIEYINKNPKHFGQIIRHQLVKMNMLPQQSIRYLQKIQQMFNHVQKNIVKFNDLKTLLLGSNNNFKGLIETAMKSQNQLSALAFLRYIKILLTPQFSQFAQAFKRILQTAQAKIFSIQNQGLLKNQQFANAYFQFIDFYMKNKILADNVVTFEVLIQQILSSSIIKQFVSWKTNRRNIQSQLRRKTILEMKIPKISVDTNQSNSAMQSMGSSQFDDMEQYQDHKAIFAEKIKQIIDQQQNISECNEKYHQIYRYSQSFGAVFNNSKFLYFYIKSNRQFEQICQNIKKWKYNDMVNSFYQKQKITNICKVFLNFQGKSQRHEKKQQVNSSFQISYFPPEQLKNINSFYLNVSVTVNSQKQCQIRFIYYFHLNKIRKFFRQQLNGKTSKMWDSLYKIYIKMDEPQNDQNNLIQV